jgi:hypothetical protein
MERATVETDHLSAKLNALPLAFCCALAGAHGNAAKFPIAAARNGRGAAFGVWRLIRPPGPVLAVWDPRCGVFKPFRRQKDRPDHVITLFRPAVRLARPHALRPRG